MSKVMQLFCICVVLSLGATYTESNVPVPDQRYAIVFSGKSSQSLHQHLVVAPVPSPSPSPTTTTPAPTAEVEVNAISSEAHPGGIAEDAELPPAPASLTHTSISSTSSASGSASPAENHHVAAGYTAHTYTATAGTQIHHHLLPAEVHPLPITISTRPGLRTVIVPETITIHEPAVARIGQVTQHIPTAVSHQSQTVVHNHARIVTPIVAPAVRTTSTHVLRAYHTPLVYAAHGPALRVLQN